MVAPGEAIDQVFDEGDLKEKSKNRIKNRPAGRRGNVWPGNREESYEQSI